ncbi:hypothetical protein XMM3392_003186 [Aliiroseovarius sp. xm-m-339-2]|nr:hypothetical protein [Aliiroseovarius sp. xm-m-339-2]
MMGPVPSNMTEGDIHLEAQEPRRNRSAMWISIIACVLLPTVLCALYFSYIQSPIYTAEVRFSVRSQQDVIGEAGGSELSSLAGKFALGGGSVEKSDLYAIRDYLLSRNVINRIGGRERLVQLYGGKAHDILSRLPQDSSLDHVWRYWEDKVTVYVNTASNIIVLRARAFSPQDALLLAEDLTEASEGLLNDMSLRRRLHAFDNAQAEVERAAEALADARAELLHFQQETGSFDPLETVRHVIELTSALTVAQLDLEVELTTRRAAGIQDSNADLVTLEKRLKIIKKQLAELQDTLTGSNHENSAADVLREFERLKLNETFSTSLYEITRSAAETARRKLSEQQKYVVRIVQPVEPESPSEPEPIRDTALMFLMFMIFWMISALVVTAIRDR